MVSVVPCSMQQSRPTRESAPWVVMASIMSPRAPLPERGFMMAVGTAAERSGLMPRSENRWARPCSNNPMAPLARNMPTATSIAMR